MASSIFIGRWTPKVLFSLKEISSSWGVAPPVRKRLAAHADQNSPQSRIRRFNRQACDAIESHCCRVLVDAPGKDNHRSTGRHVPLGKTLPQERER
jgi:hypothetical protein